MTENRFRMLYPLYQLAGIICIGLIIIPLLTSLHIETGDEDMLFAFSFLFEGTLLIWWLIGLTACILYTLLTFWLLQYSKKHYPGLKWLTGYPPELNETDEGMSYVTHTAMKKVYYYFVMVFPIIISCLIFIPDHFFTKLNIVIGLLLLASFQYIIYFLETKRLLRD